MEELKVQIRRSRKQEGLVETELGELEERLVNSIFRTFPVAATDFWELASVTSLMQLSGPVKTIGRTLSSSVLQRREPGIEWWPTWRTSPNTNAASNPRDG